MTENHQHKDVWIYAAENSDRIKAGQLPYWKCAIKGEATTYMVERFELHGQASQRNFLQDVNPNRDPITNFFAWFSFYGDFSLHGNIAVITLKEPASES